MVEVPVVYDGEDLDDVAEILGCDRDEVVRRHTSGLWTVAFCGFAPGFGYLTADEGDWSVPRRKSPRTKVPPGSVALAGEFSGVYPRESPGGWQLIGRTEVAVFELDRDPPALLAPRDPGALRRGGRVSQHAVVVESPGPLTTLQDEGRSGRAAIGIGRSGACDRASYRLANRLVGNHPGAVALEVTYGGLVLRAEAEVTVVTTGARCPGAPHNGPVAAPGG